MVASLAAQWNQFVGMTRPVDLFRPQDPHALRIAGKLLRYTFEMLRCTSDKPPAAVVRTFKRMQDALGEWHDHVVLAEWVMRLSLRELLAHHDPTMQAKALALSAFALTRSNRELRKFMTLWERRGAGRRGGRRCDRQPTTAKGSRSCRLSDTDSPGSFSSRRDFSRLSTARSELEWSVQTTVTPAAAALIAS
jgi:hypothetical protein